MNPLYEASREGDRVRLRLRFPSPDYEAEYGACRQYLPEEVTVDAAALDVAGRRAGSGPGWPTSSGAASCSSCPPATAERGVTL